jgi:2-dehydro-3-deoxy-D-arabinonate dehydratase
MRYYMLSGTERSVSSLVARDGDDVYDLSSANGSVRTFTDLARTAHITDQGVDDVAAGLLADADRLSPETFDGRVALPVIPDEVWAAGVTYEISEQAREAESGMPDVYLDVYEGERPEIFFKATPDRTVGPDEAVGVRGDSEWDVPEPELGVVLYRGEPVGYTIGNDVSSRSIEGRNPLYLPQAKVYDRCCALGPCVASPETVGDPHALELSMRITRDGDVLYDESTNTAEMVKTVDELTSYLTRHNAVPELSVLLTGTALVPGEEFTLEAGDEVHIELDEVGSLENGVVEV